MNDGTVSPGLSTGILHVDGAYSTGAAGGLDVEIAGATPGAGHDQLQVEGPIALGGTLRITTAPGFAPLEGQSFVIAEGSSVSGVFADVVGAALPAGLRYVVRTIGATVVLTVVSR